MKDRRGEEEMGREEKEIAVRNKSISDLEDGLNLLITIKITVYLDSSTIPGNGC